MLAWRTAEGICYRETFCTCLTAVLPYLTGRNARTTGHSVTAATKTLGLVQLQASPPQPDRRGAHWKRIRNLWLQRWIWCEHSITLPHIHTSTSCAHRGVHVAAGPMKSPVAEAHIPRRADHNNCDWPASLLDICLDSVGTWRDEWENMNFLFHQSTADVQN